MVVTCCRACSKQPASWYVRVYSMYGNICDYIHRCVHKAWYVKNIYMLSHQHNLYHIISLKSSSILSIHLPLIGMHHVNDLPLMLHNTINLSTPNSMCGPNLKYIPPLFLQFPIAPCDKEKYCR